MKEKDDRLKDLSTKHDETEKHSREVSERLEKLQAELKAQTAQIRDQAGLLILISKKNL